VEKLASLKNQDIDPALFVTWSALEDALKGLRQQLDDRPSYRALSAAGTEKSAVETAQPVAEAAQPTPVGVAQPVVGVVHPIIGVDRSISGPFPETDGQDIDPDKLQVRVETSSGEREPVAARGTGPEAGVGSITDTVRIDV